MAGSKLTKSETDARVAKCYELRYEQNDGIGFKEWIQYCHNNYNDKSEQQYSAYWASATTEYQEHWREKLNKTIDPAVNELISLLADEDPKIRQRAVDQIFKYTGNDVEKIEAKIEGSIILSWGTDPGLAKLEQDAEE
jgi:hypothetical protein